MRCPIHERNCPTSHDFHHGTNVTHGHMSHQNSDPRRHCGVTLTRRRQLRRTRCEQELHTGAELEDLRAPENDQEARATVYRVGGLCKRRTTGILLTPASVLPPPIHLLRGYYLAVGSQARDYGDIQADMWSAIHRGERESAGESCIGHLFALAMCISYGGVFACRRLNLLLPMYPPASPLIPC